MTTPSLILGRVRFDLTPLTPLSAQDDSARNKERRAERGEDISGRRGTALPFPSFLKNLSPPPAELLRVRHARLQGEGARGWGSDHPARSVEVFTG